MARAFGTFLIGMLALGAAGGGTVTLFGQELLPDPALTIGGDRPVHWHLGAGSGQWRSEGDPPGVLALTGTGRDSGWWRSDPIELVPGGLYEITFRARRTTGTTGGVAFVGTSRIHRDFRVGEGWAEFRFVFRQPDDVRTDYVRLGQWNVNGTLEFDQVNLMPARIAGTDPHSDPSLGEGESLRGEWYRFRPVYAWEGANYHRPLMRATARFNTDRWVFTGGAEVIYRFEVPQGTQREAQLLVFVNYHVAGPLHVEAASRPGRWIPVAKLDGDRNLYRGPLPPALFPARTIWIRLRTPDPGSELQVNRCDYEARLDAPAAVPRHGRTHFYSVLRSSPVLDLESLSLEPAPGRGRTRLYLRLRNDTDRPLPIGIAVTCDGSRVHPEAATEIDPPPGRAVTASWTVEWPEPGRFPLRISATNQTGRTLLELRTLLHVPPLEDPRPGYPLPCDAPLDLWWCESGWKISRQLPPPPALIPSRPVTVRLARREFEAVQLVLRPHAPARLVSARIRWTSTPAGAVPKLQTELFEVAYVPVDIPSDTTGAPGFHPDPLPPLRLPLELRPGLNQPLWIEFYMPPEGLPGVYEGRIELEMQTASAKHELHVPLRIEIYDFELPPVSHLRSAMGLNRSLIEQYHQLERPEDKIAVYGSYLRNFAEHRISPYSFFDYAPIRVRFAGPPDQRRAEVDFDEFDRWAECWLARPAPGETNAPSADGQEKPPDTTVPGPSPRGVRFNSFRLPLQGMGGGTFYGRQIGRLDGHEAGTPEHARLFQDYLGQVAAHLRRRGWLPLAYTYWFDEPDPKDYAFVVEGQKRIHAAAPDLKRLLTEQPEPELLGHVDIWCALTPNWSRKSIAERKAAGEEVWWYICTVPKAPYITPFIDHPGVELRLWPWQAWQYGVDGILIWSTTYWTSPTAYPDSLQNPWEDPMSWVSGYGTPRGVRQPWGNGDGRLLYPPRHDPHAVRQPCLDGPINSLRWQNLRDGMEDYEYFWLLRAELERLTSDRQPEPHDELLREARALLEVPAEISSDLTRFTTDPRLLLEHRHRIARMLEQLRSLNGTGRSRHARHVTDSPPIRPGPSRSLENSPRRPALRDEQGDKSSHPHPRARPARSAGSQTVPLEPGTTPS